MPVRDVLKNISATTTFCGSLSYIIIIIFYFINKNKIKNI